MGPFGIICVELSRLSQLLRDAGLNGLDLTDSKTGMSSLMLWPEMWFDNTGRRRGS
jgi:hypothetical protein